MKKLIERDENMAKVKPPEWGADVHRRLFEMKIRKTDFAQMLGVNYTQMCNAIAGRLIQPDLQAKILAKIAELEGGA